ncbi:MAG: hypothetical protein QOF70_770 [Acetobacteraceae bacterium]|jgi:Arc/MetJ-type ribon-helix-helix transcriptional regulator|nr:hypothetical protein [Acetobacteraceae bacterium]
MNVIRVSLPDELEHRVEREVAEGKAGSDSELLIAALREYFDNRDLDDELVAVAEAGIADAEAGRFTTIATREDGEAWLERKMSKLRKRLATTKS